MSTLPDLATTPRCGSRWSRSVPTPCSGPCAARPCSARWPNALLAVLACVVYVAGARWNPVVASSTAVVVLIVTRYTTQRFVVRTRPAVAVRRRPTPS